MDTVGRRRSTAAEGLISIGLPVNEIQKYEKLNPIQSNQSHTTHATLHLYEVISNNNPNNCLEDKIKRLLVPIPSFISREVSYILK
jgi:hypothetical protein